MHTRYIRFHDRGLGTDDGGGGGGGYGIGKAPEVLAALLPLRRSPDLYVSHCFQGLFSESPAVVQACPQAHLVYCFQGLFWR